jgi:surface antigen
VRCRLRRGGYRGSLAARPWRFGAGVLALSLALGGCSYRMDGLTAKAKDDDVTGSVRARAAAKTAAEPPQEGDLAFARAAASEVLASGGKDTALPWENPATGARGTITPIAATYSQDGLTCRDFLASFVRSGGSESWMQGEACRGSKGKWEVRHMKAWQRS